MQKTQEAGSCPASEQTAAATTQILVEPPGDIFTSGCHRCGGGGGGRIMSRLCVQMICSTCEEEERALPEYRQVVDAENAHLLRCIRSRRGDEPTSVDELVEPMEYEHNLWPAPGGRENMHNVYTDTDVRYVVGWYLQHRGAWGESRVHFFHEPSGQRVCICVASGAMRVDADAPASARVALEAAAVRCNLTRVEYTL